MNILFGLAVSFEFQVGVKLASLPPPENLESSLRDVTLLDSKSQVTTHLQARGPEGHQVPLSDNY